MKPTRRLWMRLDSLAKGHRQVIAAQERDDALEALLAAPIPRLPRTSEDIARLIQGERASWGKQVAPGEEAVLRKLRKIVHLPEPTDYTSSEAYASAYADWLRESDARLEGEPEFNATPVSDQ